MSVQPAEPPAGKPPAAPSPQDAAAERAGKLRAQLAEAEAAVPPPAGTAKVRVMPPHDSFSAGGVTVGRDFTLVPAGALAALLGAAADAGVVIKEA